MMLKYKQFLEARKNPELNPKVNAKDVLMKYIDEDKDVYISFRNINKLGINPSSEFYDTPIGIYCYRLESYKNAIKRKEKLDDVFPFFGQELDDDREEKKKLIGSDIDVVHKDSGNYIYIFKPINVNRGYGIIRLGNMTKEHVIDFIEDCFNKFNYTRTYFLEDATVVKRIERYIGILKRHIRLHIIDKNGYSSFDVDVIKQIKPLINKIDEMAKIEYNIDILKQMMNELQIMKRKMQSNFPNYSDNREYATWVYNRVKLERGSDTNGGIFWNFLKHLFPRGSESTWGTFLYKMGVVGIDDNLGESIIQSNEPYQTVFFNKKDLEVVEVILNKDYTNKNK